MSLLLLLACASRRDPLAVDRGRLLALARTPPPPEWSPHATLLIGHDLPSEALSSFESAQLDHDVPGPLGVVAQISLRPDRPTLTLGSSETCDTCVSVTVDWRGRLDLRVAGLALARNLDWAATGTAPLQLRLGGDQVREVELVAPELPDIQLRIDGLGQPYDSIAAKAIQSVLLAPVVTALFAEPLPLFTLEGRADTLIRDLRVAAEPVPRVELLFRVLDAVEVPITQPNPTQWEAVVPTPNLLGVMRTLALSEEPVNGFIVDPSELHVYGDEVAMKVKLWKVGRRHTWREYAVRGRLLLEDGALKLEIDDGFEVGREGWGGRLIGPVVKAAVVRYLRKGLELSIPGHAKRSFGGQEVTVAIQELNGADDLVRIRGTIH